jgi:hypothetical protein
MKISFTPRSYGLFGLAGFLGFLPNLNTFYMFFMFFFFFLYARPKSPQGTIFSDERWAQNLTKACAVAFFVFLIPSMFNVAFLRSGSIFLWVSYAIPIVALLSLV